MKKAWLLMGQLGFWCSWPALWVYLHGTERSRIVLRDERGCVLVVKGWLSTQKWSLPGGGLHKGEDPRLAAIREIKEEVGIAISPEQLVPLLRQTIRSKGFNVDTYIFTATIKRATIKIQRFEIIGADWLPASQLNEQMAEPDVVLALKSLSAQATLLQ